MYLHLPAGNEARGTILKIEYSEDVLRLVLAFNKQVTISIPRHQIVNAPPLLKPNEFISILRTDIGYHILNQLSEQEHNASGDTSKLIVDARVHSKTRSEHC